MRACLYEQHLLDNLVDTRQALAEGVWQPRPLASYWGHFRHASHYRLAARVFDRYPWLQALYDHPASLRPLWEPPGVTGFASQWRYFRRQWPDHALVMQCGHQWLLDRPVPGAMPWRGRAPVQAWQLSGSALTVQLQVWRRQRQAYVLVDEQGYLKGGLKRRMLREIYRPEELLSDTQPLYADCLPRRNS